MHNFVFSTELELSVIEHRLVTLFNLMEKNEVYYFYPALVFNETFWQLPLQKRISIITLNQSDWCGDNPINKSIFTYDPFILDLVKSVKLSYFNYTKINLESLVNILKTKNKFEITEFTSFGDIKNTQKIVNDINFRKEDYKYNKRFSKSLFGKILAINFYTELKAKLKYEPLIVTYNFSFDIWENFFQSLKKILETKKENYLNSLKFTVIFISKYGHEYFLQEVEQYPALNYAINKGIIIHEYIEITEISPKHKYDFIFFDEIISILPTEIFVKYGHDFFHQTARILYYDRKNEKEALENIGLINSPLSSKISPDIINKLAYEISWEKYDNPKLFELLENVETIREKNIITISIIALKFIVLMIQNLKSGGTLHILDYCRQNSNLFFEDNNGFQRLFINENYYQGILESFEDLKIEFASKSIDIIISEEIFDNEEETFVAGDLVSFLTENKEASREFFAEQNFNFYEKLKRITEKYKLYSFIKSKGIFTFGIGTLLYKLGFLKFYNNFKKEINIPFLQNNVESKNLGSYAKEIIVEIIPIIIDKLSANSDLIISFIPDSKINDEIKKILDEVYLKPSTFFKNINKFKESILQKKKYSQSNYKLITITN